MNLIRNTLSIILASLFLFYCSDNSTTPDSDNENITESSKSIIDASLKEGYPEKNFGYAEILETGSQIAGDGRGLLYFNLDSYTSNVDKVSLKIYNNYGSGHNTTGITKIYMVTSNWAEQKVTWNTQPKFSSKVWSSQSISNNDGWVTLDITDLYNLWKSGTTNYGILINTEGSGYAPGKYYSSDCTDQSKRPYLDFSTVPTASIIDATVKAGYLNSNFGNSEILETGSQIAGDGRGLLKFDLSSYPNNPSTVYLKLYNNYGSGHNSTGNTKIYKITSNWAESNVTWNNQPGYSTQVWASKPINNVNGWISFNITDLYNAWKSGTANYGIMIDTEGTGYSPGKYSSSENSTIEQRPILEVIN